MANLTVNAAKTFTAEWNEYATHPASVAVSAGQWVTLDANGKWALAQATTATAAGRRRAVATRSCRINEPLTALYKGIMDMGGALDALAFDAPVYLSDTAGTNSDTAGTVSVVVGTVTPGWASGSSADRLLRVNN